LIRCPSKEEAELDQRDFHKAWSEYVSKNAPISHTDSIQQPNGGGGASSDQTYYPHGLCKNTQVLQNSKDEELPF
jgi:hypothetical protein